MHNVPEYLERESAQSHRRHVVPYARHVPAGRRHASPLRPLSRIAEVNLQGGGISKIRDLKAS
jgi:hypothetical protein